ncbi:DUF533 domain-containing protein [Marivita sp. GX14005]|uniref:DUF533 domain-containing protein n=1 Tax=Marivita sp. GX14005 TaxID=2942276 RepID=UPI0020196D4A|nr:DUF533 domain-containing protein [Marivita sp. GX14005]MCL3883431.1 tellurite resistance TerB family protein [Marivita sp. GX14005]
MSLMGTLAKMAIGYAAARGVDHFTRGKGMGGLSGGAQVKGDNPMSNMQAQMSQMMGGKDNPLSGLMENLQSGGFDFSALMGGGSSERTAEKRGLLSSGDAEAGGGTGLAGMLAAASGMAAMGGRNMGGMLDQAAKSGAMTPEAEETAALMLRAMIQAAKSDGGIDEAERAKILETVGEDADADDIAFVKTQLDAHVDADALANDTPAHLRTQVYSASLMTIRVDTEAEAQYLDRLARAMGLDQTTVNTLHMQMGVTPLYS